MATDEHTPSWLRWPPNCCETCTSWAVKEEGATVGACNNPASTHAFDNETDSRFRCQDFHRKADK